MYLTQKEPKEGYKYWYLEESMHTERGTRKRFSMFLGKPERIYDLVQRPLDRLVLSTHNFGATAALLHGVEEVHLGETLEEEMPVEGRADMAPAQRLIMVLGARYERPASKLDAATEWYRKSMLRILWKCRPPHVNTLYETMDCLTPGVRRRIKERVRNRLLELGESPRHLIWDTTNFYTYGSTDELRRHGRSKDGKHRYPLVGMGILTSRRDIPLAQVVFPGNRHDKTIFEKALPTLLCLAEDIAEDPKDVTIIFDRGCNDQELIEKIEKTSHCVGGLKVNQDPADLLQTPADEMNHLYDTEKGHEVQGVMTEGEVFGRQMTLVVKYHEGVAVRQRRALRHYKEKALRLCPNLEERVGSGRGRPFTRRGIQDRMDELQGVEEAINWSFDEESQTFSWKFEDDEWERLLEEAGKSLLFTTHEDWSAKDIIKAYEGKWKVEHSFRLLKGSIPVRPIYHGREDRIREHCFLMYLLIVIHRYLMEQLREPVLEEFGIGEETLHRLLRELRLVTSKSSDTNKPEFVVEDRGTIENAVIRSLDLERFIPGSDRNEL